MFDRRNDDIADQRAHGCSAPVATSPFGAMRLLPPALALLLAVASTRSHADTDSDVRAAITALANTSYAWETITRQRFSGDSTESRVNLNAPIEVEGRTDPNAYTQITVMPSRELGTPVVVLFRAGDVVCHTPLG